MDIADFLLARIGAEEALARDASGRSAAWDIQFRGPCGWKMPPPDTFVLSGGKPILQVNTEYAGVNEAEHVLTWDPARVLAEIDTKRRIVEHFQAMHHTVVDDCWYTCPAATEEREGETSCSDESPGVCNCGRDQRVASVLRLLALPYAEHSDYDPEWKV